MSHPEDKPQKPSGRREQPTLKTIASLSGFAVPTVSRALSDAPDIGKETKKKVRRIAAEIGYVPNRAGLRLRTGRTNVISLIIPTERDGMNHTAQLISGLTSELRHTRYHLNVTPWFVGEDSLQPVRYIVETGSADAVILNATSAHDPRVAYLMEHDFPFATHGRTSWAEKHAYFDFDNAAFARIGVKRLAARGRRNIHAVLPPLDQLYGQFMAEGIRQGISEIGGSVRVCETVNSDSLGTEIREQIVNALARDSSIDGILCGSSIASMAAVDAVESAFPWRSSTIDIFGKQSTPFARLFRKELLSMPENVQWAGQFLARAVLQAINEPELPPLQELEVPVDVADEGEGGQRAENCPESG
ncbi:LacI family transcriptional regulator [Granulosicoccus sp. 3-233]|uniref:LacI family transcriptional regulator n=1 Tax=Granulosicoccus sp. 3-233 TaxID=3417969 RepID=UPI003D348CC0